MGQFTAQLLQLQLGAAPCGNIEYHPAQQNRLAAAVTFDLSARCHPAHFPVREEYAVLDFIATVGSQRIFERLIRSLAVLGMQCSQKIARD